MNVAERASRADELLRRLAAAIRSAQLYAAGHPLVARAVTALTEALVESHAASSSVAVGIVDDELVVGDAPVPRAAETMGELVRRLRQAGIERIVIDRGVPPDQIELLVTAIARMEATAAPALTSLSHVRVGRLELDEGVTAPAGDIATFRRLYDDAVRVAEDLWDSARIEGTPDADASQEVVDSLAQAVVQNRTALLSLTALKDYDNYTFTHMVNVSILTMGQARGLGIDGTRLREFGLAGLMHDIGKVQTPAEILTKPDQLTAGEFDILKRHTVDGAEMLRRTPEMPSLAPIVAFEHHLRADGSGYPHAARGTLNLGTTLCGIADVYDAMRSKRAYKPAWPTDRILSMLQENDGGRFDRHLVRRFVQLVGIYPAGNLVRLDSGAIAVVRRPYPPDPHRPQVRILVDARGRRLDAPADVNLWETGGETAPSVQAPLDPAEYGIDPLIHL